MVLSFRTALDNASRNKDWRKFPDRSDGRFADASLYPHLNPTFNIAQSDRPSVFTIGSCFAREIEEALAPLEFSLPTMLFSVPKSEWPHRPNGLLNEYNPGTMSQRIIYALEGKQFPEHTIIPSGNLFADLLLCGGADVSKERAIVRRGEIFDIYSHLRTSPYVVITLGLVEAWYDNEAKLFINRVPPFSFGKAHPERFSLQVMDVFDCVPMLEKSIGALHDTGAKVILTVSPVPLQTTFTQSDCVTANEFSKSVLRVCAERICKRFSNVDYFPSYEIVRSGGLSNFEIDNVHVKHEIVKNITKLMIDRYSKNTI